MECIIVLNNSQHQCTWRRTEPGRNVFAMYSLIIPMLALFGCMANSLNAIVFLRPRLEPSVFTYLAVLSWVDSLCCIVILLTCLSRSLCLNSLTMTYFDLNLQSALFGTLTGAANWILAALTMDRIVYLCHRLPQTPPRFCTRLVARTIVFGIILLSAILNSPYFFVFATQIDGSFYVTNFYKSKTYKIYNWFSFTVLCIIPGLFLLIGNISLIILFRKMVKKPKSCVPSRTVFQGTRKRQELQLKLTITIVIVVFLYLTGELPAHITSRKNAVNLLFNGDITKINFEKVEKFECFFLTLNALQLSFNIIVYAVINPVFMDEFFVFLRQMSDFVYLILGYSAMRKCFKKVRNRNETTNDGSLENHQASISYCNEIFIIEGVNHNLEMLEMEIHEENKNIGLRKTNSCMDLKFLGLGSEEWFECGRVLQRHSLSC
ncbi:uncharacterized protein LOC129919232 [Episyrphus balteatus]|uniref:uncharacterized protein LOC129919232 n=1 Tax=Episyrphus balteatus TaxID=286459 RepID=UPI00248585BC|nr:uncharacterized protein LOC129919232 [Episyrphus balteatus]